MPTFSAKEKTLYSRVGGYDVIAAVVDEFSQTFAADPRMSRFVAGMGFESQKRNRQLTVDWLCAKAGGPTFYLGPDMKKAHEGLKISTGEWDIAMEHVRRAIWKLVPEPGRQQLMDTFLNASGEIIEAK